jgi:hypothetical protein
VSGLDLPNIIEYNYANAQSFTRETPYEIFAPFFATIFTVLALPRLFWIIRRFNVEMRTGVPKFISSIPTRSHSSLTDEQRRTRQFEFFSIFNLKFFYYQIESWIRITLEYLYYDFVNLHVNIFLALTSPLYL